MITKKITLQEKISLMDEEVSKLRLRIEKLEKVNNIKSEIKSGQDSHWRKMWYHFNELFT